ncbi:Cyclohexanone monooxygenase [Novosphingobium aromaticivorans DSM 12444]|uniref:Cyclohexanone monooxygenase n=1 Tax=Novosphingobium aromaticivorans (strain ATCC 700278 / DSM 12444 / CCUG 56034 / CIP 105152 / NBRC 16084 / F199) TaxID=279238 RepID=Q2G5I5_NOVAD|nr:NAD(P)/FAD-dependent oxidoreductase [Novosphingobium aromaticivorans]ABD26888.1 Cyclohexanone monooxygenase [Novosphingobium aromaticivorans DSM 12444]SCY44661.1 4-hydroxyacetophenone monooxygenase [Novosphingobium aromaticivorans]
MNAPKITDRPVAADAVDRALLRQGVDEANIPALLMVLVQLTGDRRYLEPPYAPRRGKGLDDNDSGGLPDEIQHEVREAAWGAITGWLDGREPALARPSNPELAAMLAVAMTEAVPPEYGDIVAATMHLDPAPQPAAPSKPLKAIIIGAGISGMVASVRLREMGIEHTIFEKNNEFGGTWWENRYPGCGVDTPNLTYTFSFRPNDWSAFFPLRDEIENYLLETARESGLYDRVRFGTKVERAEWLADRNQWQVTVRAEDGSEEVHHADIVMSAVGILNMPVVPDIKGLSGFAGRVVHTSDWPQDIDLKGKRVAVVGNGASAMQVVPAIADQVAELTIFARSKQWAAPFPQFRKPVPNGVRYLMQVVPLYRAWVEQRLSWTFNDRVHGTLFRDPDWKEPARAVNAINDGHREFFTRYVREELGERQDLLPLVLPDYPPFAKRMLLDNGWYRTLRKPHVKLVPQRLAEVRGHTLVAQDGQEIEADVLILATGFQAANVLGSYDVIGRDGRDLHEFWEGDNAAAYLGTLVPGFPNFFILLGPNVGSGHGGSMIRNIENQAHYATRVIEALVKSGADAVEVREDVYGDYKARIDAAHEKLVWTHPGATNWYRNSRGRVVAITPWRNDAFWRMTREARPEDLSFSGAPTDKTEQAA